MNENQGRRPEQANFSESIALRALAFVVALALIFSAFGCWSAGDARTCASWLRASKTHNDTVAALDFRPAGFSDSCAAHADSAWRFR